MSTQQGSALMGNVMNKLWWLLLLFWVPAHAGELPEFTGLVERYGPTVVNISTKVKLKKNNGDKAVPPKIPGLPEDSPFYDFFKRFFEEQYNKEPGSPREHRTASLGSGFIISSDGYIITNHHVVAEGDEIVVRLNDRRELTAKLIGSDERSDIALIKIDADKLPVAEIGSAENLPVGAWVLAIGSPFGFEHSATAGIVSAKGRDLPSGDSHYVPFIQTDVAINPGNSGGPLFDMHGKVVGVNAQIYTRSGGFMGLSFAIPIDMAMDVVAQLREQGRVSRGWLGVMIQDVDQDLAESFGMNKPQGALIAKILPDGPASKADFKVGDIIIRFDGKTVKHSSELPPIVGSSRVGKTVKAVVMRNGKEYTVEVKLEELPPPEELKNVKNRDSGLGSTHSKLALTVKDLSADQRANLNQEKGGVWVSRVEDGVAYDAGIRQGDIILSIGSHKIQDAGHFKEIVAGLQAGKRVPVLISRRGERTFLALKMPEE